MATVKHAIRHSYCKEPATSVMLPRTQILVTQDYKTPRDKQHNSTLLFQGFSVSHAMRIMCHEWNSVLFIQDAAERSPLFGKLINSKTKKIQQMLLFFFISGKCTECRFTSTCFEQNITQVAALNFDTLM